TLKFSTIEDLHSAVRYFGTGSHQPALNKNTREIGESHGALGVGMFMMATRGSTSEFTENIITEIGDLQEAGLLRKKPVTYHGSWDYDGPGPFHKASLTAERQGREFTLKINAAYVGNEPEVVLAEEVGASIGYVHCDVQKLYEADEDGRFHVPLSDIEQVYKNLNIEFDTKTVFASMTAKTERWHGGKEIGDIIIGKNKDVTVELGFVSYSIADDHELEREPSRDKAFRLENGCITGPASKSFGDAVARVHVKISPAQGMTYDADLETRIRKLGDRVEAGFNGMALKV
ncbi:MAG: hypothetical protein ACPG05_03530, partial [Bdellovibrionales bacterium]